MRALEAVEAAGATVVLATTLLDRGDLVGPALAARNVRWAPLATYRELAIAPIEAG